MPQKVFKPQNSRLNFSRNTVESCANCARERTAEEPSFKVCGGCRSVRFCSKEHQVEYWPVHKAFCKNVQQQEKLRPHMPPEILNHKRHMTLLVEDFHRAHTHTIEESMACAMETAQTPIQFLKQHMEISLRYRPDRHDNPSTSFEIISAKIKDNLQGHEFLSEGLAGFLPMVEQTHCEDHGGQEGYMGTIVIFYIVDELPMWLTAKTIYDSHLPQHLSSDRRLHWFFSFKYMIDRGLVFCGCKPYSHTHCKPGIMEKQGSKWVWKEKSLKELKAYDIHIQSTKEAL